MKCDVEYFVSTYVKYQKFKKIAQKKYAMLPLRDDIVSEPFHTLQVELIGPWNVEIKQANSGVINIQLKALTIIDIGTFLLEIVQYNDKKAVSIANLFDQEWWCQCPRPECVIHDNRIELLGAECQEMLHSFDITPKPTTVKNPQANSIIKQVHLTIGDRCRMEEFQFDDWKEKVRLIFKSIA